MTAASSALRGRRWPVSSWATGLASGFALVLMPGTVLILLVQLAPSVLVRVLDDTNDRSVFRAVLLCNVAASVGPLVRSWQAGPPGLGYALSVLAAPRVLCCAWLAGSAAWVGSELLTMLAHRCLALRDRRIAAELTSEIERLREEWGPE